MQPSIQAVVNQWQNAMEPPQGGPFSADYNQESDNPADDQAGVQSYWDKMTTKVQTAFNDGLDSLETAAQPLIDKYHDIMNDPSVRMVQTLHTLYTDGNVGTPNSSDTVDQQFNKVAVPAAMIGPMALKNGATQQAGRDAIQNGVGQAIDNSAAMLGLAVPDEDAQTH